MDPLLNHDIGGIIGELPDQTVCPHANHLKKLVGAVAYWFIIPKDIYSLSNSSASSLVIPMIDATAAGISLSCVVLSNLAILVRVLLML